MTGFSSDWLALREPLDARSRAAALTHALAEFLDKTCSGQALRVTDLACGTGSNLRYLAPALGGHQHWRLVDHDTALLAALPAQLKRWAAAGGHKVSAEDQALSINAQQFNCSVQTVQTDLASAVQALDLRDGSLVTASALLDLVSKPWLHRLARCCLAARAPVYFALSYDGRIGFAPKEPDDTHVRDLVNRHQRTDKGFGPALGPTAAGATGRMFEALGYHVQRATSDWQLGPGDRPLQEALTSGWFEAALEMAPHEAARLAHWHDARKDHIAAGRSTLVVGHDDLFGLPPAQA